MQKLFRRATVLIAVLTLIVPMAFAQTSRTTGAITGTVTDTTGAPLPGVTVTITSPNLQGSRTEVTDANGQYTIPSLPPGNYRAEYTLSGVQSQIREGINVNAQQATGVAVQMSLAVSETVTVTASQVVVDPTQAATQTTLDEDQLQYTAVGSANRSYQNVLTQAPGTATSTAGGSNPHVSGANYAQNDWYVDGVNTTDPVTHTFGGNMAFDAIQEISIVTLGKDAEYKSSGGTINVITKSGGNEFSGSFDYRYNDPDFLTEGSETRTTGQTYYGGPGTQTLRFDKNAQTDKSEQPQATLGGPILRDRLWFFGATHRPETSRQQPNIFGFQPGARVFTGWNTHGKLTFTPFSNHTLTGKYTDSHANINHSSSFTSSAFSPEADSVQTQHSRIYALAYDAVLSSKWLGNFQVSHRPSSLEVLPISGDLSTPGTIDQSTGVRTGNYTNHQGREAFRNEILGSTTYYIERFGTHALKAGVSLETTEFTSFSYTTGDPSRIPGFEARFCSPEFGVPAGTQCGGAIHTQGGQIIGFALGAVNPESTVSADSRSFFIQDEWRPIPRLTTRIGLRYDGTEWDNNGGNPVPDFELWQPRFGVAYDIFGNASSVVHGFAGKVGDENQLTLPSHGVAQPVVSLTFRRNAAGNYAPRAGSFVSVSGLEIDPNLRPSFSNQYSLGFTQRVFANTSIDVTGEYRTQKGLFEDYCGTVDEPIDCIVTNNPGPEGTENPLRANYRAIITKIESRPTSWADFTFSWTHAASRGSTESTQNADASFDTYPNNFVNTFGYLSDDARDRLKFNGFARLPLEFILGASWNWDSGIAYSVFQTDPQVGGTRLLEPRGSRRLPHFHQLDLQLQKNFTVRGVTFGLIGSVFNVLNTELPLQIVGNAGARAIEDPNNPGNLYIDPNQQTGANRLSPTFGTYSSFQRPRRYEAGVRFEF
ncbi:MAG TPA: TonB-dependent receptor [Thermoanaerobaculia bacterium]|jgi:hypothetical protein